MSLVPGYLVRCLCHIDLAPILLLPIHFLNLDLINCRHRKCLFPHQLTLLCQNYVKTRSCQRYIAVPRSSIPCCYIKTVYVENPLCRFHPRLPRGLSASSATGLSIPDSYQFRLELTIFATDNMTGTSIKTPTTVARAAPELKPKRLMAVATASSKKLLAPISADGPAQLWATPSFLFRQ